MSCESGGWGQNSDALGPIGIDYFYMYNCTFLHLRALYFIIMLLWVCFLMNILASTASNYFSPTLGAICDKLNLSYAVAGVTFLALGNGAPDFFSLIASFSGGVDVLVGLGALLGGSVFVCTVVVGCIAILCPCEVSEESFTRDVSFHLIATTCVAIVAMIRDINIGVGVALIAVYVVYGVVVTKAYNYLLFFMPQTGGAVVIDRSVSSAESGISMSKMAPGTIQTAFWHRDGSGGARSVGDYHQESHSSDSPKNNGGSGGYSFLILKESDPDEDDEEQQQAGVGSASGRREGGDSEADEDGEAVINLSGGFVPRFECIILEDYCGTGDYGTVCSGHDSDDGSSGGIGSGRLRGQGYQSIGVHEEDGSDHPEESPLNESLLGAASAGFSSSSSGPQLRAVPPGGLRRKSSAYQSAMKTLYWNQWLLRKRFRKSLMATDWAGMSWAQRALFVVELPVTVLRDLTIPTLDDDNWYKLYAVAHPVADILLVAFLFGLVSDTAASIPAVLLCVLAGLLPSLCIYLLTHHSKAPTGRVFAALWSLTAFVMCIFWVYMLAGELVSCLSALGTLLSLPPAFLGLTVLAWGNSVGDLFTNTAVAKQGLGEMAVAGCYGGPVFNILMGLGTSLLYASSQAYPRSFSVRLDASSVLSLVFLYVALLSTLAIVRVRHFQLERWFGYYLLSLYGVYTLCQFILLLVR